MNARDCEWAAGVAGVRQKLRVCASVRLANTFRHFRGVKMFRPNPAKRIIGLQPRKEINARKNHQKCSKTHIFLTYVTYTTKFSRQKAVARRLSLEDCR